MKKPLDEKELTTQAKTLFDDSGRREASGRHPARPLAG